MSDEDLLSAQITLTEARDRYRALQVLDTTDINYQDPEVANSDCKQLEINVSVQLAEVERLIATSKIDPIQRDEGLKSVAEDLQVVLALAKDQNSGSPLLEAKVLQQLGVVSQSYKNYSAADHYYNRALKIFQYHKNGRGVSQLRVVMDAADMEIENLVKCSIFLDNMDNFSVVDSIYSSYFNTEFPARETVEVSKLPKGVRVEISGIAIK
jgi:50S ribosomal subunit-associated GTPase HflX